VREPVVSCCTGISGPGARPVLVVVSMVGRIASGVAPGPDSPVGSCPTGSPV
jgi:hypothetical protein